MIKKTCASALLLCSALAISAGTTFAQSTLRPEVASTRIIVSGNPITDNAPLNDPSGAPANWEWGKNEVDFEPADIDKDGDLDILVGVKGIFTRSWARPNMIWMNDGTGTFTDMTSSFSDWDTRMNNTRDIEAADIDGDTWLDAVVYNSEGEVTEIFLNLGNNINGNWRGFGMNPAVTLPGTAGSVCEGRTLDFDVDGDLDILRANYKVAAPDDFHTQTAPLTFTDQTSLLPPAFWESDFGSTIQTQDFFDGGILDLNLDGNVDILMIGSSEVKVAYTDGLGGFLAGIDGMPQSATYAGIAADFDRDGRADIYRTNDGTDFWQRNASTAANGAINEMTVDNTSYATAVGGNTHVTDFNGDGLPDIFINHVDVDLPGFLSDRPLILHINTGNPTAMFTVDNVNNYPLNTLDSAHGDFNGDGVQDMITASIGNQANPQDARLYYYLSEAFFSNMVETTPDFLEFRVFGIPSGSAGNRTLFNLFSVNPNFPIGVGPILGLGADILPQFYQGFPYSVNLPNPVSNFFLPIQLPANTQATIHTRSLAADFANGDVRMTPIVELNIN